jgi:hypothetical protein
MRVLCPKCKGWTHAAPTLADDYWEIKKCTCGFSGHVNVNSKTKGFTNVKGQEAGSKSKDLFD